MFCCPLKVLVLVSRCRSFAGCNLLLLFAIFAAQAGANEVATGVRVSCFSSKFDSNFCLKVVNHVEVPGAGPIEHMGVLRESLSRPSNNLSGEVRESVENHGDLKGNTTHSGWHTSRVMIDSHCLPRSRIGGGDSSHRMLHSGETFAEQIFLFRDAAGESVVPNSGFRIDYQSSIYCGDRLVADSSASIDLAVSNSSCYAVVSINKQGASATVNGSTTLAGSGGPCGAAWKVVPPPPGSLIWNVSNLTSPDGDRAIFRSNVKPIQQQSVTV